jgi:hypothetical protein
VGTSMKFIDDRRRVRVLRLTSTKFEPRGFIHDTVNVPEMR